MAAGKAATAKLERMVLAVGSSFTTALPLELLANPPAPTLFRSQ
jgi:hypothetical protein